MTCKVISNLALNNKIKPPLVRTNALSENTETGQPSSSLKSFWATIAKAYGLSDHISVAMNSCCAPTPWLDDVS